MATDRRVIMRTSVLPTQTGTLEEYTARTSHMVSTQGGRLGGNSTLTDITATQWGDGWSSMFSPFITWADLSDDTNDTGNRWEDTYDRWNGEAGITTSTIQLASDTNDLQFCYIKNLGNNTVRISLDSDSTYPLQLSSGASTMFRGYSSNLKVNEVYVKTASGTSTIEYLIAK